MRVGRCASVAGEAGRRSQPAMPKAGTNTSVLVVCFRAIYGPDCVEVAPQLSMMIWASRSVHTFYYRAVHRVGNSHADLENDIRMSCPAISRHRLVSLRNDLLQACASSSASGSPFMSKDIVQVGPLFRGRPKAEGERRFSRRRAGRREDFGGVKLRRRRRDWLGQALATLSSMAYKPLLPLQYDPG